METPLDPFRPASEANIQPLPVRLRYQVEYHMLLEAGISFYDLWDAATGIRIVCMLRMNMFKCRECGVARGNGVAAAMPGHWRGVTRPTPADRVQPPLHLSSTFSVRSFTKPRRQSLFLSKEGEVRGDRKIASPRSSPRDATTPGVARLNRLTSFSHLSPPRFLRPLPRLPHSPLRRVDDTRHSPASPSGNTAPTRNYSAPPAFGTDGRPVLFIRKTQIAPGAG